MSPRTASKQLSTASKCSFVPHLCLVRKAVQRLFELIREEDAGGHGVGDPQCLPDVLFALPDEGTHQRADVEDQRGPVCFAAQGLGKSTFSGPGNPEQ